MDFEYVYDLDVAGPSTWPPPWTCPNRRSSISAPAPSRRSMTWWAAARKICGDLKVQVIPGAAPAVSAGDPLDLSRAEAVLGWTPTFDMEAGLSHYAYELRRLAT